MSDFESHVHSRSKRSSPTEESISDKMDIKKGNSHDVQDMSLMGKIQEFSVSLLS